MNSVSSEEVTAYVKAHIGTFHSRRLESLAKLRLPNLLRRKNPYLFKSKNIDAVADLVKSLLDAHLASQEETLFGTFLEGLAIHVAEKVHSGIKSSTAGIDLEFLKDGTRYLISIKSGPNWGNSSQIKKMRQDFRRSTGVIRQGDPVDPRSRRERLLLWTGCQARQRRLHKALWPRLLGADLER